MFTESFVTSIRAQSRTPSSSSLPRDVGIHVHTLRPVHAVTSTFRKSSTPPNCLAVSSTHIFAAQAEKAVVHVYPRQRAGQEALIPFPERVHSLSLAYDGLLALGTAEGRVILWELCSGRQVATLPSHLQAVSCLAATPYHLISGSEDSNIHVWSIPRLLSFASADTPEPLRSLSNHRASITSLALGHSATRTNICVSASKDNTCVVWNYQTGDVLRTFLLHSTPLCLALDPCDRAFYVGFDDATIQPIDLVTPDTASSVSVANTIHDPAFASTPIQPAPSPLTGSPTDIGAVQCLALSYDGTTILSGHASGKLLSWSIGPRKFTTEITDLHYPITNLTVLDPFRPPLDPHQRNPAVATNPVSVVKPRVGETSLGSYTFTAQLIGSLDAATDSDGEVESLIPAPGFPTGLLEAAILEVTNQPNALPSQGASEAGLVGLQKENDDLWNVVAELRALQKRTFENYLAAKHGDAAAE